MTLRLAADVPLPLLSRDSGPGLRWILFLQGCAQPCTDHCLSPRLLDPRDGETVPLCRLTLVAEQVSVGTWGPVEGLTVLGGEPTDQSEALLPLLDAAHALDLSVMLYSGHPLRWFHRSANAASGALLSFVDLLVDGPFVPSLARAGLVWRGSTNQRIRHLTDRYSRKDLDRRMAEHGLTLTLPGRGRSVLSGLQDRDAAAAVESVLDAPRGEVTDRP